MARAFLDHRQPPHVTAYCGLNCAENPHGTGFVALWRIETPALATQTHAFTSSKMLFASWKAWCDERNWSPGTETGADEHERAEAIAVLAAMGIDQPRTHR
jgi:hypothetical protein